MRFPGGGTSKIGYMGFPRAGGTFLPSSLFADGTEGLWLDPSDLSTMWQDSAKTTSAAVDQPVGYITDKSGRGRDASQATAAARPILRSSGGLYWLEFDGVGTYLATAAFVSGAGPDLSALVAFMRAGTATAAVYDSGPNIATATATNGMSAVGSTNATTANFAQRGTATSNAAATIPSGAAVVLTGRGNATSTATRINGVQAASSATASGITARTAQQVYIGMRGGTQLPFQGRMYGVVAIGRYLTDYETGQTERYLGAKSGVSI